MYTLSSNRGFIRFSKNDVLQRSRGGGRLMLDGEQHPEMGALCPEFPHKMGWE